MQAYTVAGVMTQSDRATPLRESPFSSFVPRRALLLSEPRRDEGLDCNTHQRSFRYYEPPVPTAVRQLVSVWWREQDLNLRPLGDVGGLLLPYSAEAGLAPATSERSQRATRLPYLTVGYWRDLG